MRPYWKRHPGQVRIIALLLMITAPISLTAILLFAYRDEIYTAVAENLAQLWRITIGKEKP